MLPNVRAEFFKTDRRVDVVAKDGFSGFNIASEKAPGGFGNTAIVRVLQR
jgi:hypothetical protein